MALYFTIPYLKIVLYALVDDDNEVVFFETQFEARRFCALFDLDKAYYLGETNLFYANSDLLWSTRNDSIVVRSPCLLWINNEKDMIYLLTSFCVDLQEYKSISFNEETEEQRIEARQIHYDVWYKNYFDT